MAIYLFDHPEFDNHEQVVFFHDKLSGLKAIIAIHNTRRGPSLGGCRFWPYPDEEEAIRDVLRLSRGMSYKAAIADLPLGGGKAVILGDPRTEKTHEKLLSFGERIESLAGRYITGEDVGTLPRDMAIVHQKTKYVTGLPLHGDQEECALITALGVFKAIEACAHFKLGRSSLKGVRVAIQGLGQVGGNLLEFLHKANAVICATDINGERLQSLQSKFSFKAVSMEEIYDQDVDIFIPCALGGILNDLTIPKLKCAVVAGCANNQLDTLHHAHMLKDRGILYAPDYVINAGGVIHAYFEYFGPQDSRKVLEKVEEIPITLTNIIKEAAAKNLTPQEISDTWAEKKLRG